MDLLYQRRMRYTGSWWSLFEMALQTLALSLHLHNAAAAASILGLSNAAVSSNTICKLSGQPHTSRSDIPLSFVILSPRQSERWSKAESIVREDCTALRFWTRAENDNDLIDDTVKNGVGMRLSDDGIEEDERHDDASLTENVNLESLSQATIINGDGDVSAETNLTAVELNATSYDIDNNATMMEDVAINNDNVNTPNRTSRWKRFSSIPGVQALLPGKPLFMRLMPFKSSEIISKIMEEIPVVHDEKVLGLEKDMEALELEDEKDASGTIASTLGDNYGDQVNMSADEFGTLERGKVGQKNETTLSEEGVDFNNSSIITTVDSKQASNSSNVALPSPTAANSTASRRDLQDHKRKRRIRLFQRKRKPKSIKKKEGINKGPVITKEELECPAIATNIHELQSAVLINKIPLRDVGFRFPVKGIGSEIIFGQNNSSMIDSVEDGNVTSNVCYSGGNETIFMRDDPIINGSLSSLLTCDAKSSSDPDLLANYQLGIELMNLHPVLSVVRERVETKSKPGDRRKGSTSPEADAPHIALVIEGGGMRGAVSAGMAAALSTLDLLDAFDSIHGSSAGAIVGAYLVSRQLCTDVYTDIMPAAGSQFASKRRGMVNFGVDWLGDLIQRKILVSSSEEDVQQDKGQADDGICVEDDEMAEHMMDDNTTSFWCKDDDISSVELAMGHTRNKQANSPSRGRSWSDDHYDGVVFESVDYLLSSTFSVAKSTVAKPLSFGVRRFGRAIRPALSALDFASAMRQYLRRRPGMNLTYVLDGVMDETHGLRPFDLDAFKSNDKRQPLYVVASTVSNGGRGEMETVAFNSKDGDFFGTAQEDNVEPTTDGAQDSWYKRIWRLFKSAPFTLFSVARKVFTAHDVNDFSHPMKDEVEARALPAGTSAMYGFSNRHEIRKLSRPEEKKVYDPTGHINDDGKKGIFPCLEASMLVPGAAGPPLPLIRSKNRQFIEQRSRFPRFRPKKELNRRKEINSHQCFDAFVYEPIPYRSAVEKANATHVLALRSRPDGCMVETKQHMYERVVGPIYFRKHGMNQVAKLFSTGGSQYRYIEDILTLNEGLARGIAMGQNTSFSDEKHSEGVRIPPTELLFGNDKVADSTLDVDDWKHAHLLPVTVPRGTPELPTLSQDKDEVLNAVRNGYAAAFDILAPIAGLPFDIPGIKVARVLFPDGDDDIAVLNKPVKIKPSYIGEGDEESKRRSFAAWITGKREARRQTKEEIASHPDGLLAQTVQRKSSVFHETDQYVRDSSDTLEYIETEALLAALPGFRGGRLDHIKIDLLAKEERKKAKTTDKK